jgi:hypothetical protein
MRIIGSTQIIIVWYTNCHNRTLKECEDDTHAPKMETWESSRCRNPTLKECENDTHTPEMGTWESSETPESSELDCRSQNTLP